MNGKTSRVGITNLAADQIDAGEFDLAIRTIAKTANASKLEAVKRALFVATVLDDEALDALQAHLVKGGFSVRKVAA